MAKELKTAQEIQAEVHRLIHEVYEVKADKVEISVPRPVETEKGADGCNWSMSVFGNSGGHINAVSSAVAAVMQKWNLKV